jgi:translation initiation factor IF-3
MIMVLGPHKKKAEAKLEAKAAKAERAAERQAERDAEQAERAASTPTAPGDRKPRRRSENIDPDM